MLADFLIFGKAAGFEFRENLLAINAYLKAPAVRGYEHKSLDFVF